MGWFVIRDHLLARTLVLSHRWWHTEELPVHSRVASARADKSNTKSENKVSANKVTKRTWNEVKRRINIGTSESRHFCCLFAGNVENRKRIS